MQSPLGRSLIETVPLGTAKSQPQPMQQSGTELLRHRENTLPEKEELMAPPAAVKPVCALRVGDTSELGLALLPLAIFRLVAQVQQRLKSSSSPFVMKGSVLNSKPYLFSHKVLVQPMSVCGTALTGGMHDNSIWVWFSIQMVVIFIDRTGLKFEPWRVKNVIKNASQQYFSLLSERNLNPEVRLQSEKSHPWIYLSQLRLKSPTINKYVPWLILKVWFRITWSFTLLLYFSL